MQNCCRVREISGGGVSHFKHADWNHYCNRLLAHRNANIPETTKISNYRKKCTEITKPKSQTLCDRITK